MIKYLNYYIPIHSYGFSLIKTVVKTVLLFNFSINGSSKFPRLKYLYIKKMCSKKYLLQLSTIHTEIKIKINS
jgi:hypothetical protein